MDDMVTVDIKIPTNETLKGSQLPFDYTIQMIIDELIDSLELPRLDEQSKHIQYVLRSTQQGRTFVNQENVVTAQIVNGDTLELEPLQQTVQFQTPPPQPEPSPNSSEINVVLSVMDLNRHETVNLPAVKPVGELIRLIVGNYNLPARDNLNQIIKYKLQSKALGRFLDERISLVEAQIPPLDRLTLHREEIAGSIFKNQFGE